MPAERRAPPERPPPRPSPPPPEPAEFKPLRIRSLLTTRWLGLGAAVSLLILIVDVVEMGRLEGTVASESAIAIDDLNSTLGLVLIVVYVIGAIIFIAWFFRAYSNLPALGAVAPRHGKGWAIGGWLVPILNLWRPKEMTNDIWRASDPEAPARHSPRFFTGPVPALLGWWWASWLLTSFLGRISSRMYGNADTVKEIESSLVVDAVAQAVSIAAAVLAIIVVKNLTSRQEERAQRLEQLPATA